jgi:hypothetical protein
MLAIQTVKTEALHSSSDTHYTFRLTRTKGKPHTTCQWHDNTGLCLFNIYPLLDWMHV